MTYRALGSVESGVAVDAEQLVEEGKRVRLVRLRVPAHEDVGVVAVDVVQPELRLRPGDPVVALRVTDAVSAVVPHAPRVFLAKNGTVDDGDGVFPFRLGAQHRIVGGLHGGMDSAGNVGLSGDCRVVEEQQFLLREGQGRRCLVGGARGYHGDHGQEWDHRFTPLARPRRERGRSRIQRREAGEGLPCRKQTPFAGSG